MLIYIYIYIYYKHSLLIPCPRYALDHIPKNQAASLYARFVTFEKQHGDRAGIEDVVVSEKRLLPLLDRSV